MEQAERSVERRKMVRMGTRRVIVLFMVAPTIPNPGQRYREGCGQQAQHIFPE